MKRFVAPLLTGALLFGTAAAAAADYTIDPAHSSVGFSVRHMMVSNTKGRFKAVKGTVAYDDKRPEKTSINTEIEASSVDTNNEKRDEHLRSPDFFDVAKFPKITFKSKSVRPQSGGVLLITGDLSIHGVTKETALRVEDIGPEVKDSSGKVRRGATAATKVNRKDFGLVWNKALEAGGVVVGDEVKINLEVELIRE